MAVKQDITTRRIETTEQKARFVGKVRSELRLIASGYTDGSDWVRYDNGNHLKPNYYINHTSKYENPGI